jgi:hypothetical protein
MKRHSPTLEGFQTMFRLPSLGLAEIAWRWSFGLAVGALLAFSLREYLATLPVTAGEMFLLRTRQPALILQALSRILEGSAPRAVAALIVLLLGLTVAWTILVSVGRAAILKSIFEHFQERSGDGARLTDEAETSRSGSLVYLNFLRAIVALAAVAASFGALFLSAAASSNTDPSPGSALLIFYMLILFIGLAWVVLNWFLSLAAIFIVGRGQDTFGALRAAVDLCWTHPLSVTAAAIWFGLAHALAFVVASSAAAVPLAFAEVLPAGVVLGGLLLVTLLYFAVVDFLYIGRLAAYVFMLEVPAIQVVPADDDILSDIPGLVEG